MTMEEQQGSGTQLIDGITQQAREEADRIVTEARTAADEKRRDTDSQTESIEREAKGKAAQQIDAVRRRNQQRISVDARKIRLRAEAEILQAVLGRVSRELARRAETPEYRGILVGWIVEAALGLGAAAAEVNASAGERSRITDDVLRDAERELAAVSGRPVRLEPSSDEPLMGQGVVLVGSNGRTAFNNQVPTRMQRYANEIRRMIYRELFEEHDD